MLPNLCLINWLIGLNGHWADKFLGQMDMDPKFHWAICIEPSHWKKSGLVLAWEPRLFLPRDPSRWVSGSISSGAQAVITWKRRTVAGIDFFLDKILWRLVYWGKGKTTRIIFEVFECSFREKYSRKPNAKLNPPFTPPKRALFRIFYLFLL